MQRRAAAIYFVLFLVVGAGAWAYIGYAEDTQRPQFDVSGETFEGGTSQTIGDTEYTVPEITGSADEPEATLTWTNESMLHTATISNDTVIPYRDDEYRVLIANESNVSTATLREAINVTALLLEDPDVENSLATQNDTDYVVYRENQTLVPLEEYLPERNTAELAVDDTLQYEGNETTVRSIATSGITVGWIAPGQESTDLSEGSNVTLANDEEYFAHFRGNTSVVLAEHDQYSQYATTVNERDYFNERIAGLWGVVILAALAAVLLLAAAYMPVRG